MIAAIKSLYRTLGMPVHLSDSEVKDPDATACIVRVLGDHGNAALGGHTELDEAKTERIILATVA